MRAVIYIIVLFLCFACGHAVEEQIYENHKYTFIYYQKDGKCIHFELIDKYTRTSISGTPVLIFCGDEVMECNYDIDTNDPLINDSFGVSIYQCDSAYFYNTDTISVSFAREIMTRYRLSLDISYRNNLNRDEYCTLYRISPKSNGRTYIGSDGKIYERNH